MGWRRLGRIYVPAGEREFLVSHASVPFAEALPGGRHRIWFSPRDARNRSHVASLVVDLERPGDILDLSTSAALGPGPAGSFDDCGAMMSWLTQHDGRRRLYYIGWNTRASVPFHVSIGLADAGPSGDWLRQPGPVLERGIEDPWFCSNPCVVTGSEGSRMWYLSGLGWETIDGRDSPSYHICSARSVDGVRWRERGRVAIPLEGDEFALARPSVLSEAGGFRMWFCARTRRRPYRLGAAWSEDGVTWRRTPEWADLQPEAGGWDSEMVAYPHVFDHGGRRWMLYCGNGFGASGFGLAVWD